MADNASEPSAPGEAGVPKSVLELSFRVRELELEAKNREIELERVRVQAELDVLRAEREAQKDTTGLQGILDELTEVKENAKKASQDSQREIEALREMLARRDAGLPHVKLTQHQIVAEIPRSDELASMLNQAAASANLSRVHAEQVVKRALRSGGSITLSDCASPPPSLPTVEEIMEMEGEATRELPAQVAVSSGSANDTSEEEDTDGQRARRKRASEEEVARRGQGRRTSLEDDHVSLTAGLERLRAMQPGVCSPAPRQASTGDDSDLRTWVGVGISAGGLESVQEFVAEFRRGSKCTIIVVQHLSPDYPSMMSDILARSTELDVVQVEDGMKPLADTVYTTPPGKVFTISKDRFCVRQREVTAVPTIINTVFCCLAQEYGAAAVGVILSGTGSDGAKGIVAIKTVGGTCMAENDSATFDGMPLSALQTGSVDIVASPAELARHVIALSRFPIEKMNTWPSTEGDGGENPGVVTSRGIPVLSRILNEVARITGQSFHAYKEGTVARRIERRVAACGTSSPNEYLQLLSSPSGVAEAQRLVDDLLIHVTGFFRDGELWDYLRANTLPELLDRVEAADRPLRLWVPGCSTGQEAYSFACLLESLREERGIHLNDRLAGTIFATDIDQGAIDVASRGIYTEMEMQGVPDTYRDKYFMRTANGEYQVQPAVRKRVVFAQHNILSNPPYFQIDLISCRNLLIYFKADAQTKVLHVMRYALRNDGLLALGHAEALTKDAERLFSPLHERLRLFRCIGPQRRGAHLSSFLDMSALTVLGGRSTARAPGKDSMPGAMETISKAVNEFLVRNHAPPTIVFNDQQQLLFTVGDVSKYVSVTKDQSVPSLDVMKCVRPALVSALSIATRACRKGTSETSFHGIPLEKPADYKNLVNSDGEEIPIVNLTVSMLWSSNGERLFAASFCPNEVSRYVPLQKTESDGASEVNHAYGHIVANLEDELKSTRAQLQTTVEELESANEELQSTIEELLSSNEELQSTNEELQSVNEELFTVNNEYTAKIRELTELNLDLVNLLHGTNIGCIFLDQRLCIRKYTEAVSQHIPLRPGDIGRPLRDLARPPFSVVITDCHAAVKSGVAHESEVCDKDGRYFLARSLPYRDERDRVIGAVVTFLDVTNLKTTLIEVEVQRMRAESAHRAKSEFLESVSHETRSPVHAISGFAEILLSTDDLSEESRRCVSHIYKSSRLLTSLLDDVLLYSAAENGQLQLRLEEFNVLALLQDVCEVLSVNASEKDVSLIIEVDPQLPLRCVHDISRLRQVLLNLTANGIKFTEKGYVKLSAQLISMRAEGSENGVTKPTAHLRFLVIDSGCGIEAHLQERVFEKFVQQDATVSRKAGGVGLGLSIVRKLVSILGGTCTLTSEVGKGSTFKVELECGLVPEDNGMCCLADYAGMPVGNQLQIERELGGPESTLHHANISLLMRPSERCNVFKSMLSNLALLGQVYDTPDEALGDGTKGAVIVIDMDCLRCTVQSDVERHQVIAHMLERFDVVVVAVTLTQKKPPKMRWTKNKRIKLMAHPVPFDWLLQVLSQAVQEARTDESGAEQEEQRPPTPASYPKLAACNTVDPTNDGEESSQRTATVLVVDDNKLNLMVARRMLNRIGCDARTALNGLVGIREARATKFDFVLCDLAMPGLSGFDMLPLLRSIDGYAHTPIIALTATKTDAVREKALVAGFNQFLSKPVGLRQIAALVESLGFQVQARFQDLESASVDQSRRHSYV